MLDALTGVAAAQPEVRTVHAVQATTHPGGTDDRPADSNAVTTRSRACLRTAASTA